MPTDDTSIDMKPCAHCGEPFPRSPGLSPGNWANLRYCSPTCRQDGRRATMRAKEDLRNAGGVRSCKQCGDIKPLSDYPVAVGRMSARCRSCQIENSRTRYWSDPEKARAVQRDWAAKHPEEQKERFAAYHAANPERELERSRRYNEEHREERREADRQRREAMTPDERRAKWRRENQSPTRLRTGAEWRVANREKQVELGNAWRLNNPERCAQTTQAYYDRKVRASISPVEWDVVDQTTDGTCYLCDVPLDAMNHSYDHVVPLSKGGLNVTENIRPCCRSCNSKKGAQLPDQLDHYRTEMARRIREAMRDAA